MEYKDCFEIMGNDRNSYSKTDLEATFIRMKEDHMLNGQLKPAYNIQIAVENYFIIHGYVSNDRTDYNMLIRVLEKHWKAFGNVLEEVTAGSGCCSEKNRLYLKENQVSSYIKLQDHEKRKTRAYKGEIGKYYNMEHQVFEDEHHYICHDGRELAIFVQKARSRTAIPRPLRYMDVRIAAAVSISRSAYINTMQNKC